MAEEVLTEPRGRVLLITLNRPDAMNSVDTELAQGLNAAVAELDGNDELAAGVLTGAGRGFSAGMDLKAFASSGPPQGFDEFLRTGARKPLVAAVEGFALAGGLEIALCCDLIVAAKNAKLGIPEVKVGLFAAGGALIRLGARVPYALAMELALTGAPITGEQALAAGLVSRASEPGQAVDEALALAEAIAQNAPLSLQASKGMIKAMQGLTDAEGWAAQQQHMSVFTSADAIEGATAFAEKRAPNWQGR